MYKIIYSFCNPIAQHTKDYYKVLEIQQTANQTDIRLAYVKQASRYHPDSPQRNDFQYNLVREAFAILSDEKLKTQYDLQLKQTHRTYEEVHKDQKMEIDTDKTEVELQFQFRIGELNYPMTIKVPRRRAQSKQELEELATYHMRKFVEIDGGFSKHFAGNLNRIHRGLGWVIAILRVIAKRK